MAEDAASESNDVVDAALRELAEIRARREAADATKNAAAEEQGRIDRETVLASASLIRKVRVFYEEARSRAIQPYLYSLGISNSGGRFLGKFPEVPAGLPTRSLTRRTVRTRQSRPGVKSFTSYVTDFIVAGWPLYAWRVNQGFGYDEDWRYLNVVLLTNGCVLPIIFGKSTEARRETTFDHLFPEDRATPVQAAFGSAKQGETRTEPYTLEQFTTEYLGWVPGLSKPPPEDFLEGVSLCMAMVMANG